MIVLELISKPLQAFFFFLNFRVIASGFSHLKLLFLMRIKNALFLILLYNLPQNSKLLFIIKIPSLSFLFQIFKFFFLKFFISVDILNISQLGLHFFFHFLHFGFQIFVDLLMNLAVFPELVNFAFETLVFGNSSVALDLLNFQFML